MGGVVQGWVQGWLAWLAHGCMLGVRRAMLAGWISGRGLVAQRLSNSAVKSQKLAGRVFWISQLLGNYLQSHKIRLVLYPDYAPQQRSLNIPAQQRSAARHQCISAELTSPSSSGTSLR